MWAALCLGVTLAAPQNFVRLLPADFSGQGFRAIQAGDLGSHALHTINQVKINALGIMVLNWSHTILI